MNGKCEIYTLAELPALVKCYRYECFEKLALFCYCHLNSIITATKYSIVEGCKALNRFCDTILRI